MYGAASANASSFVVHHTDTQQIFMAAVAGDADKHQQAGAQDAYQRGLLLNSPERAN